jgi:hypothetical protein
MLLPDLKKFKSNSYIPLALASEVQTNQVYKKKNMRIQQDQHLDMNIN